MWALLRQRGQDAYIPDKPNTWKAKDGAQEAHEAIRPTDFNLYKGAECAERGVNAVQIQLYQLIFILEQPCLFLIFPKNRRKGFPCSTYAS